MNVRNITSCPTKLDVFRSRGRNLGCSVGNEYHCMLDEKKHHVELCISRSWIQPDHCPEYNTAANRIDVTSCDASEGVCPSTIYWSNTTFQYNGCLRNSATVNTNDPEEESSDVLVPVVISVVIVLLLVFLSVVLLCFVKRRLRNKKGNTEEETSLDLPQLQPASPEQLEKGRQIIEEHRSDSTYVPTNAANKGKEILNKKKILVIKGRTGSGKTKTALQIASEWMKEDEKTRQCIYLNSIDDHRMLNVKDNTCFVLDDCFTRWVLDSSSSFLPELCVLLPTQVKRHKNMYLIITVNDIIFFSHRQMLQKYSLFSKDHKIILNDPDFEEKKKMLNSHFEKSLDEKTNHLSCATEPHTDKSPRPKLTEKKLNELLSAYSCTSVGFPSVCWMSINIPECTKEGSAFFRACGFKLAVILTSMKNPLKCCLHYAMLQRKRCLVDTNSLDQKCLKELRDIFGYKEMTENSIQDCFEKEHNYFSVGQNSGIYTFSQNILYEQCLKEWIGEVRRDRFLLLCNIEQVKENIRDEDYKVESADVILRLKKSEYSTFAPKFASLLKVHEELEHHPLLQNKLFRKHVDEECAKQKMKENLTHENETGEIPNQSLSDGEKSKGSEDTCTWKSEQPMQASPQLTLDEKEQEDSPLLNENSV